MKKHDKQNKRTCRKLQPAHTKTKEGISSETWQMARLTGFFREHCPNLSRESRLKLADILHRRESGEDVVWGGTAEESEALKQYYAHGAERAKEERKRRFEDAIIGLAEAKIEAKARRTETAKATTTPEDAEKGCTFRPLRNWREVDLNGETISLRNRERAKDFLRYLWNKGATRRSKAAPAGKQFPKPSALFVAGERFIRKGTGQAAQELPVPSELGALIRRVYREAVVCVKARRGTTPPRYYLRAFPDSDKT